MPKTAHKLAVLKNRFIPEASLWKINESLEDGTPSYDPEIYCARLVGPMALYGGASENKRFYPKELWDRIVESDPRDMFGTIGHDQEMEEADYAAGLISHKTSRIWINKENGTVDGEVFILRESEVGRRMANYIRAGLKISVSSRAYGSFNGRTPEGYDIVDPNGFLLQGFDFVLNPGVPEAQLELMEELQEGQQVTNPDTNKHEDQGMSDIQSQSKELFESLKSQGQLQVQLNEALSKANKAELSLNEANQRAAQLQQKLDESIKVNKWYATRVGTSRAIKELNESIAKYLMVPEFQEIAKAIGMFDNNKTTYAETYGKLVECLGDYAKKGSLKSIDESKAKLAQYEEAGSSPKVINEALDLLERYKAVEPDIEKIEETYKQAQEAKKAHAQAKRIFAAKKICEGLKLYPATAGKSAEQVKADRKAIEESVCKMLAKMPTKLVVESLTAVRKGAKVNESAPKPAQAGVVVPTAKVAPSTSAPASASQAKMNENLERQANTAMRMVGRMKYNPITTPNLPTQQ